MPAITFEPSGRRVECDAGQSIFEIARSEELYVDTACIGAGTCGRCRVKVLQGEVNLSAYNDVETKHLGNVYFITKERLSCQALVSGDVRIELPKPPATS